METKILDNINGLPYWMQFIILILMVAGFYGYLFYSNKRSKKTQEIASLTGEKLNQLLDVLYEKCANAVTNDVANNAVYTHYQVMKYNTLEHILLQDRANVDFKIEANVIAFEEDLLVFIKNKYYETSLSLGKLKLKNKPLNFYMTEKMFPVDIVNEIVNFIKCRKQYPLDRLHRELNYKINGMFDTYINKTCNELETLLNT